MRRIPHINGLSFLRLIAFGLLLAASSMPVTAQRTVVQDGGGGRKLQLHYDAAGKVTEIDTVGADGQILQKQLMEYPPGGYVPLTTSTSYWPNGKVHRITRDTYDKNANFTGEYIQIFDESGKQIAGHELSHDPQANTYHCADWNVAAQKYLHIKCPAGEESSGTPEEVKKFTQDEVMHQLASAREAAQHPKPEPSTTPPAPVAAGTNVKEVGLILPARIRPGDRVSGSVVEDPGAYDGQPEIMVTRVALPFAPSGADSTLAGWTVEMSGEPPQKATGPIALTIPPGQIELALLFRPTDNSGAPVSKAIPLPHAAPAKTKRATAYLAPAICLKDQLCVLHGPFSGDSSKTFAAFQEHPAQIIAETIDSAYLAVPDRIEPGPRPLLIAEGSKVIVWPMVVAEFSITPDRRELKTGEKLLQYVTLEGAEELPDPLWLPGNYPASNLDQARRLVPGFQMPHASREAREQKEAHSKAGHEAKETSSGQSAEPEEEGMGGEILIVVKNQTPDLATFHESKNGTYVFHLQASSFQMGEFKYKFVAEALKPGSLGVKGWAIPFLAPVAGQEFAASAK